MRLVSILFNNETYQLCLLPSRESALDDATYKPRKTSLCRDIFARLFPSVRPVEPERIKTKIRWLVKTYTAQKKKLSFTGAGLLEGMDASDPVGMLGSVFASHT